MSRPWRLRHISGTTQIQGFKPMGIPVTQLEVVQLQLDELEALRLADKEGLYQEEAAERMGVSRVTFGRILQRARAKVSEALLEGKVLLIGQGHVQVGPISDGLCPVHGGPRRRGRGCQCKEAPGPNNGGGAR